MQVGYTSDTTLTNLRFADDILLVGKSLPQIKKMTADVANESAEVGLALHPDKTKTMHNNIGYGSGVTNANINGMSIEVLQHGEFTMYLGRALCLPDSHEVELHHRMRKAWAKFGILKHELIDKNNSFAFALQAFSYCGLADGSLWIRIMGDDKKP